MIMSISHDPRGGALHAFDAHARALSADLALRFELGERIAGAEIETLSALARGIAASVAAWGELARGLNAPPFDGRRAGVLVLEVVFDELLDPAAWRVLAAALELAQS